jgi:hypothetical protein
VLLQFARCAESSIPSRTRFGRSRYKSSRSWQGFARPWEQAQPGDGAGLSRCIRKMRGFDMTQAEFAERIGIGQSYLPTMEHSKVEIGAEILFMQRLVAKQKSRVKDA